MRGKHLVSRSLSREVVDRRRPGLAPLQLNWEVRRDVAWELLYNWADQVGRGTKGHESSRNSDRLQLARRSCPSQAAARAAWCKLGRNRSSTDVSRGHGLIEAHRASPPWEVSIASLQSLQHHSQPETAPLERASPAEGPGQLALLLISVGPRPEIAAARLRSCAVDGCFGSVIWGGHCSAILAVVLAGLALGGMQGSGYLPT